MSQSQSIELLEEKSVDEFQILIFLQKLFHILLKKLSIILALEYNSVATFSFG